MQRRTFITLLGGTAAGWPWSAHAQQKAMPVIGWLSAGPPDPDFDWTSFRRGLAETGYVDGQNVAIEHRSAEARFDKLPALAAELVERHVDVIFATAGVPGARAAKDASSTIPIVFLVGVDPVARGLVDSLSRPGGNLTGFTIFGPELNQKRIELLSELVPAARSIAILVNPTNPTMPLTVEVLPAREKEVARAKGLEFHVVKASTEAEIDAAFITMVELHADALLIRADPLFFRRYAQIAALALNYAVPAIHDWRRFAETGGLISYGADIAKITHEIGSYLGRILRGTKPQDLPVQQPTKFELVINLKTARALGLSVPPSLLARADEVIE